MKLTQAARYFDRLPVYDAYSNRQLFKAQFDLFDDSKRDAINVMRRTLSVAPLTKLPDRLAINAGNQYWVIGRNPNSDTWGAGLIRTKYTLQMALGLATVRTPGEIIANTGGTQMYAGLGWTKDWKEVEYGSKVYPYYEVFVSPTESVLPDHYVELDGKILRVRGVYFSEAGFLVAESDDLGTARVSVTYRAKTGYNPATDALSLNTSSVPALNVRYAADYQYELPASQKREEGDVIVLVRKSDIATAQAGDTFTFSTKSFSVLSVQSESDCWNLHGRPIA